MRTAPNMKNWTFSTVFVLCVSILLWSPQVLGMTAQEAALITRKLQEVTAQVEQAKLRVINNRELFTSFAQTGLPTIAPATFTTAAPGITASACEYGTMRLSCAAGNTLLILDANYGRTASTHGCSNGVSSCRAANSLSTVRSACQGRQTCSVTASSSVFGDPCRGAAKYLEATYLCITESNVALRKTASQSSGPAHWGAGKAVDGARGTRVSWYNECTHTNRQYQPWWKVDLAGTYTVNRVRVLNRGDCCGERLRNFMVRIGPNENFSQNGQCGETYTATPRSGQTIVVYCEPPMAGRYVSIQLIGRSDNLQLCEVDVFAETG